MIVFDLQCKNGHRFEGWFDDLESLEDQISRGLVTCPSCEETDISRIPSTFGIKGAKSAAATPLENPEIQEVFLQKVAQFVDSNFDDVGSKFTDEALKIHYGVSEPRNIRGTSTKEQEDLLTKEGVSFVKFPVPAADDSDA